MPTQVRNGEMLKLGATDNQFRFDPAIGFAEADNLYLSLPGLVGYWPGNAMGSSSASVAELSDKGPRRLNLTRNGTPNVTAEASSLAVWQEFNGTTDWYSHADATSFDITAGLTIMAWVWFDTDGVATERIAGKWGSSNNSYVLYRVSGGTAGIAISVDGTTSVSATAVNAISGSKWYFLCGRYSPSAQLKIWDGSISNLRVAENTTSIPASIYNGTALFGIGGQSGGANFLNGRISRVALCNMAVPDQFIDVIFQRTRQIYPGAI